MSRISRIIVFILIGLVACTRAGAVSISVANSGFEAPGTLYADPTNWTLVSGVYMQSNNGTANGCPTPVQGTWELCAWSAYIASDVVSLDVSTNGTGGSFTIDYDVRGTNPSASGYVGVEFFDGSVTSLGIVAESAYTPVVGAWTTRTVSGAVPATAESFRVVIDINNFWTAYDAFGAFTWTPSGGGSGGGGGSFSWTGWPGDASSIGDWEDTVALGQAIQDVENELQSFTCPNDLTGRVSQIAGTVTGVLSVVGGLFGGGAQVLQLIKILNNAKKQLKVANEQLCELTKITEIQEAIFDGLSIDKSTGDIILHPTNSDDPASADLGDTYLGTIGAFPTGGDDVVSAVNKNNKLVQAAALANMEAWDRALGGQRLPYELDRGPLITVSDISSGEPNLVYAEGDFSQNYSEVDDLRDAAGVVPSWDKHLALTAAAANNTTSCLTPEAAPSGTGIALAWSTVRWNARQTFANSDFGALLCDFVANQSTPVTGSICLLKTAGGFGVTVPGKTKWQLIPTGGYCIAGPSAPSWTSSIWSVMPNISMLMAAFALIKMLL